jgi:4-hydroxy-2-oxoheptanedioate aldolase
MSGRRLIDALAEGDRPLFGTALKTCDPAIVEVIAIAGYDWVSISIEHSSLSMDNVAALQRAADFRGITTLLHVAEPDDPRILPLLNEGLGGIVGCQVESAAEAEEWVAAALYAPRGRRGAAGVVRRADYGNVPFAEYARRANEDMAVGIVIETVEGVENA